ncbi:MAG: hypothetical protein M1830_001159, partial [Pleopsidium flavum]
PSQSRAVLGNLNNISSHGATLKDAKQICVKSKDVTDLTKEICETIDEEDVTQHPDFVTQAVQLLKDEVNGVKQTRRDTGPLPSHAGYWHIC